MAGPTDEPGAEHGGLPPGLVVGVAATLAGLCARWWIRAGSAPLVWNDSADYRAVASAPPFSAERLLGARPPLTPLLLAIARGDDGRFVALSILVAAVAWGVLAGVVHSLVPGRWRPALAALAVLGLSLSWPVAMWDQQVLSESNALALLALVAAAGLWFADHPSPGRAVVLVAAAGGCLVGRDSMVVPVALAGVALGAMAVPRGAPRHQRRTLALTGAYLVALSFLVVATAAYGQRDRRPLEHVYAVRVLPYPDRVAWFAAHGMPEAQGLAQLAEVTDPAGANAPFTAVPPGPEWARWRRWLAEGGRSTYLRYVATHPAYLWSEPRRRPERVFNNGDGLATYRPADLHEVPLVAGLLYPPTELALAVAALATVALVVRRGPLGPVAVVGLVLVGTAGPHALAVWHGDGMESARHLLLPGVQLRLGAVLLVAAASTTRWGPVRGTAR